MSYINGTIHNLIQYSHSTTSGSSKEYQIHFHNVYEIYYFISGDVDYLVEGKTYRPTPHSLLLLAPNAFHGVRVNSELPYERYTLHFHPDLLNLEQRHLLLSSFPSNKNDTKKEVCFKDTKTYHLDALFHLFDLCHMQEDIYLHSFLPTYLESILATINLMSSTLKPSTESKPASDTLLSIMDYISSHLQDPLTLDFLCTKFYISKNHLNSSFKKATGTTVYDYILHKRVTLGKQLLYNGLSSINAATACGFGDYSNFYRAYHKVFGYAPTKEPIKITRKELG